MTLKLVLFCLIVGIGFVLIVGLIFALIFGFELVIFDGIFVGTCVGTCVGVVVLFEADAFGTALALRPAVSWVGRKVFLISILFLTAFHILVFVS